MRTKEVLYWGKIGTNRLFGLLSWPFQSSFHLLNYFKIIFTKVFEDFHKNLVLSFFFFNITVLSLSLWSSFIFSGFSKDNPHLFVLSTPSYLSVVLSIPFSTFCMIIRTERTLCYFSPSVTENGVEAKTLMPLICRRLSSSSVQLLLSVFLLAVCVLGIIIICSRNSCG